MNRDEFVINASEHEKRMLYKRFCKDNNIPINLFEDPYFYSRLELYDDFYNTKEKWNSMWDMLKDFDNVQDYFEYYDKLKDKIINDIKDTEAYQSFINHDTKDNSVFVTDIKNEINKRNLYSETNDKQIFLSIDMKKANFYGMKFYNKDMFKGNNSWEKFMSSYTSYQYIQNSKYIRQVILGNCNPRRQVSYSTYLMCNLFNFLRPLNLECISIEADELIFKLDVSEDILNLNDPFVIDYLTHFETYIKEFIKNTPFEIQIPLTIDIFRLYKIDGTNGYIKKCITNDFEIQNKLKCFNSVELPFVLRALKNETIKTNDMIFYAGDINRIAVLKDPIDVLIPKDLINHNFF